LANVIGKHRHDARIFMTVIRRVGVRADASHY
jgi:hypothetical protein